MLNRKKLRLLVALLVAFFAVGAGPSARAEDPEAIRRYEHGVKLYESGAFDAALLEFQAAYELTKNVRLLFNIGAAANEAREHAIALGAFRRYLAEGGASVPEDRRASARAFVEQLELVVRDVSVVTDAPDGSEVQLDDRAQGRTPLPPILVKVGRHRISVSHGERVGRNTVDIPSGKGEIVVRVNLQSAAATAGVGPSAGTGIERRGPTTVPSPSAFPWWAWGATGVLGAGAIVTGALAVDAKNDAYRESATFGANPSRVDDYDTRARGFAIATDILLGATIVTAAVATILTISHMGTRTAKPPGQPPGQGSSGKLLTGAF